MTTPDRVGARVVERVFRWRAEGQSYKAIRERLNANRAKTQRNGKPRPGYYRHKGKRF